MLKVLKYSFYDQIRSRWSYIYLAFYLVVTFGLLYLSGQLTQAIASLMKIVLILSPLVGTMFGIMHYYNSREFIELLLAQPLKRKTVFLGQYLGLAGSLSISFLLGLGIPFLVYGVHVSSQIWNFATLLMIGVFLTFIFTALAFLIALVNTNRIKGFGLAIILWLFLAVLYDGLFLLSLIYFDEYPTESLALGLTLLNPIDLSRILMMLKLDISALMGYTGAVFQEFFGTWKGMVFSIFSLAIWVGIPVYFIQWVAKRKDF